MELHGDLNIWPFQVVLENDRESLEFMGCHPGPI